jgi:hypothetical protein
VSASAIRKRPSYLRLVEDLPKKSMARDQVWRDELDRLVRRMQKIRAVLEGEATVKKVDVMGHWVKRHWVSDHERILVTIPKRKAK